MSSSETTSAPAATEWKPPAEGSPCWVSIPALSVPRAKEFYATVFSWTFRPADDPAATEDVIAMFSFPESSLSEGGGIQKVEDKATVGAGVVVYLYVDDIEKTLEKIENAGGKAVTKMEEVGKMGLHAKFMDTEGNVGGIYTLKK